MAISPILRDADSGDDVSRRILPTDAAVGSGAIQSGALADASVVSGSIGSGQVGNFQISSGAITSGRLGVAGTPNGTLFLRDDFTWAAAGGTVGSGDIGSGKIASGAVQGFFGTTRHVASGTIGSFDLGSGAVTAGTVGSGAVVSANIGSGQVGNFAISSGAITSGRLGVTGAPDGTKFLRDDFTWQPAAGSLASGTVQSGAIASGAVQGFFGATRHIASGTVGGADFASGSIIDFSKTVLISGIPAAMTISGGRLVTYASGLGLVVAEPESGIRFPVLGFVPDNTASGAATTIVTKGVIPLVSGRGGYPPPNWQLVDIVRLSSGGLFNTDDSIGTFSGTCPPVGVFYPLTVDSGFVYLDLAQRDISFIYPGHIASGAVYSGSIARYAINDGNIASGAFVKGGSLSVGGSSTSGEASIFAAENIPGVSGSNNWGRLFAITDSGYAVLACNQLSGRMPAVGIAIGPASVPGGPSVSGNIASGASFRYYLFGRVDQTSFLGEGSGALGVQYTLSGMAGQVVFAGRSGGLVPGQYSGAIIQAMGVVFQMSGNMGVYLNPVPQTSSWVGLGQLASGSVGAGTIASGAVVGQAGGGFNIASGSIGGFDLGNNVVLSAHIGSGQVSDFKLASGTRAAGIQMWFNTAELISGVKAVALASGSGDTIVRAERQSGLRLPAIGVTVSGNVSGGAALVVMEGPVYGGVSGMLASGFNGQALYVGSGGLIVNKSGFMDGASSGAPTLSGSAVQMIGVAISGGIEVEPELRPQSGLVTAAGQGTF